MVVFQSSRNWALSLSLVAAGVLVSESAQAVGLLTPPPPDSNVTINAVQMVGAGINVKLRDAGSAEIAALLASGFGGFCPGGGPTNECAIFDFKPDTTIDIDPDSFPGGNVFFSAVDPNNPGDPFTGIEGTTGAVRDVILPFLGAPVDLPNLNLALNIPGFIDANLGDDTIVDTFDATQLAGIIIQDVGSGSNVTFSFNGFWNIMNPDGSIGRFRGGVSFSQTLSDPVSEVIADTRTPQGRSAGITGQADVVGRVPEPSAMAGLAVVAGLVAMQRKGRAKR